MKAQEHLNQIAAAFQDIIQELNLHPTRLNIELTIAETVHVYLTAPEFAGKTDRERDLMIWPALEKKLTNRALMRLSVCMLMAPDEEIERLAAIGIQKPTMIDHADIPSTNLHENFNVPDPKPQEVLKQITAALHAIIKERNLHPTQLEIELSEHETVHICITAPEFSGKTYMERELMIRPALEKILPLNVIMNISIFLLFAPEDEVETQEERLLAA